MYTYNAIGRHIIDACQTTLITHNHRIIELRTYTPNRLYVVCVRICNFSFVFTRHSLQAQRERDSYLGFGTVARRQDPFLPTERHYMLLYIGTSSSTHTPREKSHNTSKVAKARRTPEQTHIARDDRHTPHHSTGLSNTHFACGERILYTRRSNNKGPLRERYENYGNNPPPP